MNRVSCELAAVAATIMVLCAAILSIQRLASNKNVETMRLIVHRSMALLMCVTSGIAVAVFDAGYPAEANSFGLTPYRYWTILAVAYCALMLVFAAHVRWRPTRRTNAPFVW